MSAEIDLPYSGSYGTHTRSGGYVEPYGVDPHEDQFLDYRNRRDNFDEDCEDFMSDGVASDEGVYYSSGAEEGYDVDDDGPEEYSDEGYSSPSDEYYDDD
ncbi:hypothetical protein NLJ89_g9726 [Agrocybe chaxingu]|uniref:Uncharacterized protein n=1 Tax=Agrocybe chaxingu TaxID=84603 RepID=A0A9W8MT99_9AGAR|nr:hypothetical protein NLJ89_g9726 [Agrocybe chaxingu]